MVNWIHTGLLTYSIGMMKLKTVVETIEILEFDNWAENKAEEIRIVEPIRVTSDFFCGVWLIFFAGEMSIKISFNTIYIDKKSK